MDSDGVDKGLIKENTEAINEESGGASSSNEIKNSIASGSPLRYNDVSTIVKELSYSAPPHPRKG